MRSLLKYIGFLTWPVLVLGAALWIDAASPHWSPLLRNILAPATYLACALGAAVAWRFNHSNAVMSFVLFAGAVALLAHLPAKVFGHAIDRSNLRMIGLALIALDLAWLGSVAERGLLSPVGRNRLAILLAQALIALIALWIAPGQTAALVGASFLPAKPAFFASTPDLVVVTLAFATGIGLVALVERFDASAAAQLGAILALGHAALGLPTAAALAVLGIAALLLAAATVQDSYRAAFIDPLTGLPARRALEAELRRLGDRHAIAMLDVDRFKTFNDTYGHAVGDQVLKLVGARLDEVGGNGKPFRYGGEEFTVVFSGRSAEEALPALEALRAAIERSSFRLRARDRFRLNRGRKRAGTQGATEVSVTISIGVAETLAGEGTPDETIKRADAALYRAKDAGRNRVSR
jgi:diguanylate cyclase (GGDEF)-like protein